MSKYKWVESKVITNFDRKMGAEHVKPRIAEETKIEEVVEGRVRRFSIGQLEREIERCKKKIKEYTTAKKEKVEKIAELKKAIKNNEIDGELNPK